MRASTRTAIILALATTALVGACAPVTPPTDFSVCPAAGAGQVRVAVVVDSSDLPVGANPTPSVVCVVVATGSSGLAALQARAARIGSTTPRLNDGGLLCGIDGAPAAPACGDLGPNGYEYWGYYLGGTAWDFAPVGPAGRIVTDGSVDGWSFQAGAGDPPATSAVFADLTS